MNVRSIRFRLTAWYATILVVSLTVFCAAVYFGMEKYLTADLSRQLSNQANQVAGTWMPLYDKRGPAHIIHEIEEHIAPRLTGHFLRLTAKDGTVLYEAFPPNDEGANTPRLPPAAWPEKAGYREDPLGSERLLIYSLPYTIPSGQSFLIEVGGSYAHVEGALRGLTLIFAIMLPLAAAAAVIVGYFLSKGALNPVDKIINAAESITLRNLSGRLPLPGTGDEIERLSVTLNRMIARLEQSFNQISQFTSDASHELRTPLTILRGELEVALRGRPGDMNFRHILESTLEETEKLSKTVENLMVLSRLDSGELKPDVAQFDLADLCRETVDQMHLLAEDGAITLKCSCTEGVSVKADPLRLRQVLINLIDNAIKYTPAGGRIDVCTRHKNGNAIIQVQDTGVGIPAEALPHIFDRFYRVDKARARKTGGTGLGLAIAKSICELHGGTIHVESAMGVGTGVVVSIPVDNSNGHRPASSS
ncbi:MAG TPA: ATP-binding protein [Blastocatellia bacterium]